MKKEELSIAGQQFLEKLNILDMKISDMVFEELEHAKTVEQFVKNVCQRISGWHRYLSNFEMAICSVFNR